MARIQSRRMFWTDPAATDLEAIEIYVAEGDATTNDSFLAAIEADQVTAHAEVAAGVGEYFLANLPEDKIFNLAIAGRDDDGNHSDVAQHPAWVAVPLDVTPPDAPVPGGLD